MNEMELIVALLSIIIAVGVMFGRTFIPVPLLLIMIGMAISEFTNFPHIDINPDLVLNVFLPLLVYQISSSSSWRELRHNLRPVLLLSVGHVLFITCLIAVAIHYVMPQIPWPLAFVIGAVLSPPDDVALVAIAEKIRIPSKLVTILAGEGLLNDVTALILFRFGVIALATQQFSLMAATGQFFLIIIGETIYGLVLGNVLGQLRLKIKDPLLHMIASFITPFLAYIPPEKLGGSGILATVVTGYVISHIYAAKFQPEFRLLSRAIWPTLGYIIESLLFLLVGLDLKFILDSVSEFSLQSLVISSSVVIGTVIIGRFIYVYPVMYLMRFLSKKDRNTSLPWQFPFIVSWSGMRGAISLAAALAVPSIASIDGIGHPRNLIIFLAFVVIIFTLVIQGLTLPWILKILNLHKRSQYERYTDNRTELLARLKMTQTALEWLKKELALEDITKEEITTLIQDYSLREKKITERLKYCDLPEPKSKKYQQKKITPLGVTLLRVEKEELHQLFKNEKITHAIRNKLLDELDHRSKQTF
jgi:CPA1 family monovalent cation:H+ antiporter